ncbi:hypothetical protein RUM43_014908 [Polyplax serrata]|uniref:Uncharacterized protein n=1 Tax=Polyplax serrata TaxID=468196 RepID=A0AAN8NYT1_POLSC
MRTRLRPLVTSLFIQNAKEKVLSKVIRCKEHLMVLDELKIFETQSETVTKTFDNVLHRTRGFPLRDQRVQLPKCIV